MNEFIMHINTIVEDMNLTYSIASLNCTDYTYIHLIFSSLLISDLSSLTEILALSWGLCTGHSDSWR